MVTYLVRAEIFLLPSSPCLDNLSRGGIATARSCIIIDELMYGPIPIANNVPFISEPPVIILIMLK